MSQLNERGTTLLFTAEERDEQATKVENEIGHVAPGIYGGCPECQSAYGMEPREFYHHVHVAQDIHDEGGFSWHECELCGSNLGGDRYAAHASKPVGLPSTRWETVHLDVCSDCLMATANGEPYPSEIT